MNAEKSGLGVPQILRIVLFFAALIVAGWVLFLIRGTLLPFAIAFVLAYLLTPLVDYIESHQVNRISGVLAVLVSLLGGFVVLAILFVPVLVGGLESMMTGFVGQKQEWPCVMVNRGESELRIESVETSHPEFTFVGLELPMILEPGARDTLTVQFKPSSSTEQHATIDLFGHSGDDNIGPIPFYFIGNGQDEPQKISWEPTFQVVSGSARVVLSGTFYRFGNLKPGYIDNLKMQIAVLQPQLEAAFPSLKEVDLANYGSGKLQAFGTDLLKETPAVVGSLLSGVTFIVIVPLVLFFFLSEGRAIKRTFIELIPNQYFEMVLNLLYRIDVQLGGYMRGMIMSVVIISLISVVGLWIIGLNNYLVVGLIAGVSNVIPYLGPLIGIITGAVAAAIQYSALSWGVVLPVIVVFLIVQIMDNVFVAPIIVAKSVNLHPLIVIFVVLVGSHLFGAVGMILAVPATAVIKVSVQTIYEGLRSYSI